jgi:hypothetical protein
MKRYFPSELKSLDILAKEKALSREKLVAMGNNTRRRRRYFLSELTSLYRKRQKKKSL